MLIFMSNFIDQQRNEILSGGMQTMGKAGKGYKKPGKKRAFSKKDWIWTSVLAVAVIAAVVILALVIRSDDFLRTENGKLQMEPNWLVANYSKTSTPQYYQIGSVGEIPGFTLGDESAYSATKYLHAQDENADAQLIYISGAASDYAEMAKYLSSTAARLAGAGREALYSFYTMEETPAAETAAPDATETASAETEETAQPDAEETAQPAEGEETEPVITSVAYDCIRYDEGHCVSIQVNVDGPITEEEAVRLLTLVGDGITFIQR